MPRPLLTRSRILAAGVEIVDEIGFAALSLRSVARRVHSTATSVQRLIGPTELIHAVVAELVTSMPSLQARGDWKKRLQLWAADTRTWLEEYPGLARVLLAERWDNPVMLDRVEELASVVREAGLTAPHAVLAAQSLCWYVFSSTDLDESMLVVGGDASNAVILSDVDRWPALSADANGQSPAMARSRFTFGVALLVDGITKRVGSPLVLSARGAPINGTRVTLPSH